MLQTFTRLPPKRQEKILDAAAKVFAREGYDKANVAQICREAGISMGALYKYFQNKEAILLAVIDHGIRLMVEELYGRYTSGSASIFEAIEGLFSGVGEFTRRYRAYVEIWVNMGSCSMNRFGTRIAPRVEGEARRIYLELVDEAKHRGELPAAINSDLVAQFLDNHMCLYTYSLVSEYHRRRFDVYFKKGSRSPSQQEKVDLIVASAKTFLRTAGIAG